MKSIATTLSSALLIALVGTSCNSGDNKPAAQSARTSQGQGVLSITEGEAGGTYEETLHAAAKVTAIDHKTRKVTLQTEDGAKAELVAPPEVRNFEQIKVGDTVNATVNSQVRVFVDGAGASSRPSLAGDEAVLRAPQGAKPGAIVAQQFQATARVKSIDAAARKAVLEFVGGETRTVSIRPDVDLSKYKAGDTVVILVTQQLAVLVEAK